MVLSWLKRAVSLKGRVQEKWTDWNNLQFDYNNTSRALAILLSAAPPLPPSLAWERRMGNWTSIPLPNRNALKLTSCAGCYLTRPLQVTKVNVVFSQACGGARPGQQYATYDPFNRQPDIKSSEDRLSKVKRPFTMSFRDLEMTKHTMSHFDCIR